jgi:pimeloyl-ACP methyl ester carboxylesterase
VAAVLTLLAFCALTVLAISAYLLYRALSPEATPIRIAPESLLGDPASLEYLAPDGTTREGWLFPGRRGAPTIVLAHGYQSSRADLLPLAASLQENRFHVFLFDFSGHGRSPGRTTLGYAETRELLGVIATLAQQPDLDPERFGIWGTDLGAYAALAAAAQEPRIRALVAGSVYDHPEMLLRAQVDRIGLGALPLVHTCTRWGFRLLHWSDRMTPPLSATVAHLGGSAKLFIRPLDDPVFGEVTLQLFLQAPEPKQQEVVQKGGYVRMLDTEKRSYEARIVSFFLQYLPVTSPR